jgi:hypothetical protein
VDRVTAGCVATLFWCLWKNRNDVVWSDERKTASFYQTHHTSAPEVHPWEKPHHVCINCNVDADFLEADGITKTA